MQSIHLKETTSTNTELARLAPSLEAPALLYTDNQIAGRGQRGNTWESEPGLNVTMSLLLRPRDIHPRDQFAISRAVSIAVVETVDTVLSPAGKHAVIKWPNDIYVDNGKLAGILIEHTIDSSSIVQTIVGLGLNVNQVSFCSDAPNPVSLKQILGRDFDVTGLVETLAGAICAKVGQIGCGNSFDERYQTLLWRRKGLWPYRDVATGRRFMATIDRVDVDGRLILRPAVGSSPVSYYFKEVAAMLE